MATKNIDAISRAAFLKNIGLSASTLMAFYCIGVGTTACGSKDDNPNPGGNNGGGNTNGVSGTTTGSSVDFTVDLTASNFTSLKTAGAFSVIGDVLVARTTGGSYVALARACTHQGTTLRYRSASNDLFCSNHGAEFTISGSVQKNPSTGDAIQSLKVYSVTISEDGNTLTVKA